MTMTIPEIRLYVIGDIHGRLDLLERIIELVNLDIKDNGGDCLVVTLGDYVDRGPNSRGVLDCLLKNPFAGRFVALKGNHEALLEEFLGNPTVAAQWWRLGGRETLRSFDISVRRWMTTRNSNRAATQLRAALSPEHMEFLASLKTSLVVGRYFLCHAGVRPGIPLEQQDETDLLWIRDDFLSSRLDFGKIIVHGHTPVPEPELLPNRINVDTGAFATGRLTCAVLNGGKPRFITT